MFADSRGTRHAAIVNTALLLREVIAVVDISMHYIVVSARRGQHLPRTIALLIEVPSH